MSEQNKPLIIFDTDMDSDCDDAGALAIIFEYVKRKKAKLLGIIADAPTADCAACCEAFCNYYGITCPIGALHKSDFTDERKNFLDAYEAHHVKFYDRSYSNEYAKILGKSDVDYPSAVTVYRKLLADAPDNSVTVVCVGLLTAMHMLLLSDADDISELSGKDLVARKVKNIVSMGHPDTSAPNFNWNMDGHAAEKFFELCPVPVYVSGEGTEIITGQTMSEKFPPTHPIRNSYDIYMRGPAKGRSSWDLIAVLYALEPTIPVLKAVPCGTCMYDEKEARSYWADGNRTDYSILMNCSMEELEQFLEARLTGNF